MAENFMSTIKHIKDGVMKILMIWLHFATIAMKKYMEEIKQYFK